MSVGNTAIRAKQSQLIERQNSHINLLKIEAVSEKELKNNAATLDALSSYKPFVPVSANVEMPLTTPVEKNTTCVETITQSVSVPTTLSDEIYDHCYRNDVPSTVLCGITPIERQNARFGMYTVAKANFLTDVTPSSPSLTVTPLCPTYLPQLKLSNSDHEINFPEVISYSGLAKSHPSFSAAVPEVTQKYLKGWEEKTVTKITARTEIIGDNLDWTISPSHMTKDSQRQSLHWFLNMGVFKRILGNHLPIDMPKANIALLANSEFLPSKTEVKTLDENFIFHITQIMCKHIDCLKPLAASVPPHIEHSFITEMSRKSDFIFLDLLDKSENKADEMISILQHIHENYISQNGDDVATKKVFGGDVLTNERAYTAQLAMQNADGDFAKLQGVVHQPEGLHRLMNFTEVLIFLGYFKFFINSCSGLGKK